MALNAVTLKASIVAKIQSKVAGAHLIDNGDMEKVAEAIAEAIVDHFHAAAVVNVAVAGVTPGGASVPGVGTVT